MKQLRSVEELRLDAYRRRTANWKLWGPYLSDRSWGTVREDYSAGGTAWDFLPHDHARSVAYRWGEDGIGGICDRSQYLCFAPTFWNGRDPILKERFFGLTAHEGNHGEDVKECYYYLDSTPTHSYMKMLYKYPLAEFPYLRLVDENRKRSKLEGEFELLDTGVFDDQYYCDCYIEYAKASERDIYIRLVVANRSAKQAQLHLLPTIWFRNTWSWGYPAGPMNDVPGKPQLMELTGVGDFRAIAAEHPALGSYTLYSEYGGAVMFTDNDTNAERLYGLKSKSEFAKDAFHRYLIQGDKEAINSKHVGTKAAIHYLLDLAPGEEQEVRLRLCEGRDGDPFASFEAVFADRKSEADEFFDWVQNRRLSAEERSVQRQAFAGLLWSKQLFYYDVEQWLSGDPGCAAPPAVRRETGRNVGWEHLTNFDIISMPDKWEFPWYAAWDLAFHCLSLDLVDSDFAKRQMELMTREWYMHPNGQIPAYEWAFNDVNPPVHPWATWRVYKIDAKISGQKDLAFLEGIFHKLLLNFTWWVNRKDVEGKNIFQGGFLGLDNIGIFDRSAPLPTGGYLAQADGTSWMAAYCLWMLSISQELAESNPVYQDSASKFLEHFLRVSHSMNNIGGTGTGLWDEEDGFYYDMLCLPDGTVKPLRVRTLVGLIPLFAVDTIDSELLSRMPDFKRRLKWFVTNRPHLSENVAKMDLPGMGSRRLCAIVNRERLVRVLSRMLDESEFLSPYGIRSLSKYHEENPFRLQVDGVEHVIGYEPGESRTTLFGGNSNWRGPIWFPINYLIIESLQKFHHYYGDELRVECPTGSGNFMTLEQVARELSRRLTRIFLADENGERPFAGGAAQYKEDPHWNKLVLFNEYFHGDSGKGLGASHQTGWTALIAKLIQQSGGE